jgi:hypothetical protein
VEAVRQFAEYIKAETLAVRITFASVAGVEPVEVTLGGQTLQVYVKVLAT